MKKWQILFVSAAFFNVVTGIQLLFAPENILTTSGFPIPDHLIFQRFNGILVFCLGLVLGLIALDIMRYRPLVWIMTFGKAAVFLLFTFDFLFGKTQLVGYLIVSGDLIFVLLFLKFLIDTRGITEKANHNG